MEGEALSKRAKRYSSKKYSLTIFETLYLLVLLFLFLGTGLSKILAAALLKFSPAFLLTPFYLLAVSLAYYVLSFPLIYYHTFILEHQFGLSNQKRGNWFMDQLKGGLISYIIGLILISAFYFILKSFPGKWWLVISLFWIFFSLVLARLTPIIIIPLFFKYKKLSDEALRRRILNLADKMRVKILDVFEIDFSKKTLKANAAFVGWGKTRRVLLADTLQGKFTPDEIEAILAHEFAHYKLKHLIKLVLASSCAIILLFYSIFKTSNFALGFFGFSSLSDIAALPAVFIYFILFGIILQPLENFFSRACEKNADSMAIKAIGSSSAFISMMEKLAEQNLADRSPHPLIKFYFFDHPPIDERIKLAKGG